MGLENGLFYNGDGGRKGMEGAKEPHANESEVGEARRDDRKRVIEKVVESEMGERTGEVVDWLVERVAKSEVSDRGREIVHHLKQEKKKIKNEKRERKEKKEKGYW